ncbi:MAG: DUF58 domain-containing protein [Defluviitaleaceae bacterium]|nr:DUF58 domain-containing protein [Defluviitaleaceae bacterium]
MVIVFMGLVVFGLVLLQGYVYRKLWDKGLSLNIRFSSKEAFEGDNLFLYEDLTNNKILPLPWVFVKFNLSRHLVFEEQQEQSWDYHYQSDLFSISMYQTIRRKLPFVCSRRGFYRLRNISLTCNNLLHTQRFNGNAECFSELMVFPKMLDNYEELSVLYKTLDATILSNSLINPDPFEFKGIREYQPTDPLRDINFKASAVAQHLMVNIHAPTNAKRLEIVLNLEPYRAYPHFDLYEQAIRLAATVAGRYIDQDVKVGFYTNGRDVMRGKDIRVHGGNSPAHHYSILQAMALIGLGFPASPIADYLDNIQDDGAVYLIISTYHEPDFVAAIESMENRGLATMVVLPIEEGMKVDMAETNKVNVWTAM